MCMVGVNDQVLMGLGLFLVVVDWVIGGVYFMGCMLVLVWVI